jgi:hypothetical protein
MVPIQQPRLLWHPFRGDVSYLLPAPRKQNPIHEAIWVYAASVREFPIRPARARLNYPELRPVLLVWRQKAHCQYWRVAQLRLTEHVWQSAMPPLRLPPAKDSLALLDSTSRTSSNVNRHLTLLIRQKIEKRKSESRQPYQGRRCCFVKGRCGQDPPLALL